MAKGNARFTASTAFIAKDRYSPTMLAMRRATNAFGLSADRTFIKVNRRLKTLNLRSATAKKKLKGAFGPLASVAPIGGIAAITAGIAGAVRETILLDDAATAAAGKFGLFDRNSAQFKSIENAARKAGATTEFTAAQAAEALRNQATAGFTLSQSITGLIPLLNLATASQADLSVTSDVAAKTMNAFGLTSKDAAVNTKNLTSTTDVLMKTINTSGFSHLPDILTAIGNGAATVSKSGGDLSTFSAAIGTLASSGIEASKTGTDVRNIYQAFTKTTGATAKILKSAGVSAFDKTTGKMRDMFDILGDLQKGTAKWKDEQKLASFNTLFGARTVSSVNILMDKGAVSLKKYREQLRGSGGETAKVARLQRKTLGNSFKVMVSSVAEMGISLVTVFKPALVAVLSVMVSVSRGVGEFVKNNEMLVKVGASVALTYGVVQGAIIAYHVGVLMVTKAQKLLTVGTWAMNAAFFSNPIVWVAAAVVGLGVAVYLLLKRYGLLEPLIKKTSAAFSYAWTVVRDFGLLLWAYMGPALSVAGTAIKALGLMAMTYLVPAFKFAWTVVKALGGMLWDSFGPSILFVVGLFGFWFKTMYKLWAFVGNLLIPVFKQYLGVLKTVGSYILNGVLKPIEMVLNAASKLPGAGGEYAAAAAKIAGFREALIKDAVDVSTEAAAAPVNLQRAQLDRQETIDKQSAEITINDRTGSATMEKKGGNAIPIRMTSTADLQGTY